MQKPAAVPQPLLCWEPSKLQVSPVPPHVTALKHLKIILYTVFHFSTFPIRCKEEKKKKKKKLQSCRHLGDFETAEFLKEADLNK